MSDRTYKNPAVQRFIDRYGMSHEEDGFSRTAGRMLALMCVEGRMFSFSELAEILEVSRGSISTNTRYLEKMGLIERLSVAGGRQDYFQMVPNPELGSLEYWLARQSRKEQIVEDLLSDGDLSAEARERMEQLLAFMRATTKGAREMIASTRKK